MSITIGIIGNGFVGQATNLFNNKDVNVLIYDVIPSKCVPPNTILDDLKICNLIFICVPTPMKKDKSCSLKYIYQVLNDLNKIKLNRNKTDIILRSTVPIGTSKKLNVHFMPEFLTEKNWKNDVLNNKDWVIGLLNENDQIIKKFDTLFTLCKKNNNYFNQNITLHFITTEEAELCKYVRNTFLAVKVSFFNEIEQYCNHMNINYENIRKITTYDKRIGSSHMNVPGHDGRKGYGGICFPKDINSLLYQFEENGFKSYIIKSSIYRNEQIDRPEKDWISNKGRAVE